MKIQCEIIRDILPLYAEDMVSKPTREMVEVHLADCEGCRKELDQLHMDKPAERKTEIASLQHVKKTIRKAQVLLASIAVLVIVSFGMWLYGFMNVPVYLSQEEAVKSVYVGENGALVIDYFDYVRGSCGQAQPGYTQAHICHSTRWDMISYEFGWMERVFDRKLVGGTTLWVSKNGTETIIPAEENTPAAELLDTGTDKTWLYIDYRTGKAEGVLWDGGEEEPGEWKVYAMYNLGLTALIMAGFGIAALIGGRFIKHKKLRLLLGYLGSLMNCYAVSTYLILGTQTICYNDYLEPMTYIGGLTALLWITVIAIFKLRKLDNV